ncbi:MAG TPA: hypothetical protein VFU28_20080, partial [Vicinamibacterales bacterium]|nr:hypothetical protein [Vicinamibacterales bacterium]
ATRCHGRRRPLPVGGHQRTGAPLRAAQPARRVRSVAAPPHRRRRVRVSIMRRPVAAERPESTQGQWAVCQWAAAPCRRPTTDY